MGRIEAVEKEKVQQANIVKAQLEFKHVPFEKEKIAELLSLQIESVVELLTKYNKTMKELSEEKGHSGEQVLTKSAKEEFDVFVEDLRKEQPTLSYEQAYTRVCQDQPVLFAKVRKEAK